MKEILCLIAFAARGLLLWRRKNSIVSGSALISQIKL